MLSVAAADDLAWVRWRGSTAATALRVAADVTMSLLMCMDGVLCAWCFQATLTVFQILTADDWPLVMQGAWWCGSACVR
jgi:hypothetical protein